MSLLFYHPRKDKVYTGDTLEELVFSIPFIQIDYSKRRLIIYDQPDTVALSQEYRGREIPQELARRAKQVLINNGWQLYRRHT